MYRSSTRGHGRFTGWFMAGLLLAQLALLSSTARAQGVYHNQRIFVVPAPGPVKVDGDLAEWDLSGEILTYVVESSMAYQSAKIALMYDAEALYVAGRVADPTPMLNRADPAVNPDFGWDGDAFQLRLALDPALGYPLKIGNYDRSPNENLVHMTMWYHTDGKLPVLHCKYGMDYHDAHDYHKGVVPAGKYQGAYVLWPDGKGYTFEYRIPWSTLGGPAPLKAGDLAAAAIQLQWSDATGQHSYGGGWAVDLMAHAGFTYQSTHAWGKAIFAEKGHLPKELTQEGLAPVRQLPLKMEYTLPKEQITSITLINDQQDRVRNIIPAESRPAGKVTELWDGLDDGGTVLPPGEYTWKGVYHDPLKTKFVLSVSNSGTPPWNTPNGKGAWGGDWGLPEDLCFAGDHGLLIWGGSEAGTGLIGVDAAGKKLWGYRIGGTQVATDGTWVFAYLNLEKQIRAYKVADGTQVNFTRGELWAEPSITEQVPVVDKTKPAGTPPTMTTVKAVRCTGLAYLDGRLYVADATANELVEYNAKAGTIERRLPVPAPTWVTAAGEGQLLVLSEGKVRRVQLPKGELSDVVSDHLDQPQAIAVGADGTLYVSNGGKLQQVSVFGKDGKFLRSIGKAGGRAMADYTPPADNPHLSPSRAGAWDSTAMLCPRGLALDAKGRLWVTEHDFAPKRISIWDPASGKLLEEKFGPAYVSTPVCMDPADPTKMYCQNVEWTVDLDKGTWQPSAVMFEARPDTPYFWPHMVNNLVFTAKNGRQYMSAAGELVRGDFLWTRRGDHFVAVAGVISPWASLTWRKGPKDWSELKNFPWLFWEDKNGDGVIQQDETRVTKMRAQNAHAVVDANLNFYATSMYNELYWERLAPKEIRADGVPFYDDATLLEVPYAKDGYTYDLTVNPADGSVLFYAGSDIKNMGRTGIWPLTYWNKDGVRQWRYRLGCRWHDMYEFPVPKAGQLYGCTRCMGITDGLASYSCYFGQAQVITTDGVPVGTLNQDGRAGAPIGPDTIQCEWFTGQLCKLKDGRWFLLGGDQDGRIQQVLGLDTVQRFEGKLTITPAESQAAAAALAEWTAQQGKAQSPVLARCPDQPNWGDIRAAKVVVDGQRSFVARLAYNATSLLVHYEVQSPNALVNSTPETNILFKGGNLLDVQLAADPAADAKRTLPAPGDLRVLISQRADPATPGKLKPIAVVYRPKVAAFTGEPLVFTSPTGKELFDQIEVWDDLKLVVEKTDTGFTATATLPLAKLGFTPKPGTALKLDLGYIFGNDTGNVTSKRAYWSNRSMASQVTQDVPNEARLEPAQWGGATVE